MERTGGPGAPSTSREDENSGYPATALYDVGRSVGPCSYDLWHNQIPLGASGGDVGRDCMETAPKEGKSSGGGLGCPRLSTAETGTNPPTK
jgi:hypothetical protein